MVPLSLAETEEMGESACTTSHWPVGELLTVYLAVVARVWDVVKNEAVDEPGSVMAGVICW